MKIRYLSILLFTTNFTFAINAVNGIKSPFPIKPQMAGNNIAAESVVNITNSLPVHSYKHKSKVLPKQNTILIGKTFDYQYIGDIQGSLYALKQYDPQLQVLPSLGKQKPIDLNIDVTHVNINDLIDIITQQAKGDARVIFNPIEDSIRLIFDTSMSVGVSALQESKKWQEGKTPRPVLSEDGMVIFPYGVYQPTLICQPLQICDIVFEPQEKILSKYIGDSVDWQVVTANSGDNHGNEVQHIILKPLDFGLDTTLLINTNKRTYMIKLRSSSQGYVSRIGFYYPDSIQNNTNTTKQKSPTTSFNPSIASNNSTANPESFDFNYIWSGDKVPWKPLRVFNDGHHVYIQLPDTVTSKDAPLLMVYNDDTKEQVDFGINNHMLIVDMLFDKAVLFSGLDGNAKTITIEHKKPSKFLWF